MAYLRCIGCKEIYPLHERIYACKKCGSLLEVAFDGEELKKKKSGTRWREKPLSVWRYEPFLPHESSRVVTLDEGGTRLHRCRRLEEILGIRELYVKNEGENPTGSFKDRGMTVGVTEALAQGARKVICASTGNTSSSLAAYAAKAGLDCFIVIPSGKIAKGKLAQAIVHGARIIQIEGGFDEALRQVSRIVEEKKDFYLLNSINPFRIEGQKTIAFEISDQLHSSPDRIVVPVGNAGNISAIWKGFKEYEASGELSGDIPRMIGIQAENAAPITKAYREGRKDIVPIGNPETLATAIRIGAPVSWKKALDAVYESKGVMNTVTDEEILEGQRLLARSEGIFVEPASATTIAGVKKMLGEGIMDGDEVVVCVTTGHGLKDTDIILNGFDLGRVIRPDSSELHRLLGG